MTSIPFNLSFRHVDLEPGTFTAAARLKARSSPSNRWSAVRAQEMSESLHGQRVSMPTAQRVARAAAQNFTPR